MRKPTDPVFIILKKSKNGKIILSDPNRDDYICTDEKETWEAINSIVDNTEFDPIKYDTISTNTDANNHTNGENKSDVEALLSLGIKEISKRITNGSDFDLKDKLKYSRR